MMLVRRVALPGIALGLAAVVSCQKSDSLPGTSLGTFAVVATLGTNTCGSGISATNPWDFDVEMSKDSSTLYLAKTDGSDEVSGTVSSTTGTLASVVTTNADGSDAGAGVCDLTQSTSWALTLASASSPASFSGTVTYTYAAATGVSSTNDCTDQLTSSGGTYATLPCTVTYSLAGTRQ
jgi:hypothetical protein